MGKSNQDILQFSRSASCRVVPLSNTAGVLEQCFLNADPVPSDICGDLGLVGEYVPVNCEIYTDSPVSQYVVFLLLGKD